MASYTLPDTVHGGSVTVSGNSLADAQKNAASQTGASLSQQQGGGTFGVNTNPSVGSSPSSPSTPSSPAGAPQGANLAAGSLLLQQAQQAAYQAYLDAKLKLDTDTEAYQKAAQVAATTLAEAGVTGTYMGQPTQAAIKQAADIAQQQAATMLSYATTFGVWGTPTQGEQTLAGQQQGFSQAQQAATLTGWYTPQAPPQGSPAGQYGTPAGYTGGPVQTIAGQAQDLAKWQAQQTASQNYLTMLAGLRGPADWAQYQKVLGATPGGTQDLVRAAAGQYIPGGGATTGVAPQAADLNTLYNQATGADTSGQSALTSMQNTLVAPNQMAPQTWNALQPSQQQMLLGVWESQGYSKADAQNLFNQSLPKYATSPSQGAGGAGAFKLQ